MGSGHANVGSRQEAAGNLIFDGSGKVVIPGMARVHKASFTTAEVNAGATILPALPGLKYRLHDMALIAVGGAAAAADSVDILGTQATSGVKLLAGLVAGLAENVLLRAGAATNGVILAAGASFADCDANTAITIGKTGSSLTTATSVIAMLTYTIEEA